MSKEKAVSGGSGDVIILHMLVMNISTVQEKADTNEGQEQQEDPG